MTPVIISPITQRFLCILMFLFIPISIVAPHAVVLEIIFGGLIGLYYSRKHRLTTLPYPLIIVLLAIPLWGLVTTLWSKYPLASLLMSLKILALVILGIYWCRFILSLAPPTQKTLIRSLIGGLFLGMFFLLVDTWFENPWQRIWVKSSSKAYAQASLMLSLTAWPVILWAFRRPYTLLFRISLVICLLLSIFWILFQIDCDTAPVGLMLGLCIFAGTLVLPRITSWGLRLLLPLFIISFPLVSLYAFKPENIPTYNAYFHSPSYIDRLYIWNEVATTIFEHPWLGIGIDGTPHHEKTKMIRKWTYIDQQGTHNDTQSNRFSMHPHNAILQLWLELGFMGIILGALLAHLTLYQIFRTNLSPMDKAACAGLFTGTFLIVWVNLGFWQNWWISGLWIIIGLTIMSLKEKGRSMKAFFHNLLEPTKLITKKLRTEWVIFASDMLVALLCLYVSLRILLGKEILTLQMSFILKHCIVFALISFSLFSWFRSDQGSSRYATMEKIPGLLACAVLANLLYHPLMLLMGSLPPLTPVLNSFLFMVGLVLPRLLAPFWKREEVKTTTVELLPKIPVIVIGYDEQIGAYLRANETSKGNRAAFPYQLEGILLNHPLGPDDLPPPFPVLGMINDFVSIVQKLSLEGREPKRLLITQESLNHIPLRQILLKFQGRGILSLRFEVSPATHEVNLCPLRIDDLIGKANLESSQTSIVGSTWQQVQALIDSTRVLITGVHDPVINQLAHNIVSFYPKRLIIVDPSEQALAGLKIKFNQLYPDVSCDYVVSSITDRTTLDRLIKTHHPQIVIHGDRITDPELIAQNLSLAVQKNIVSPLHFAQHIQETEACLFVLVNAQSPTRLTRLINSLISSQIQALDEIDTKKNSTRFLVINSCDVWNNLDSITAFWAEQLSMGYKITLPSPDAYSYLISAEEAARTILQAIVKALINKKTKGQILNLTGGEPTRYLELIRSIAILNGLIPEIDVKINFSGESSSGVSFEENDLLQPLLPGITMGITRAPSHPEDDYLLTKLADHLEKGQTTKMVTLLEKVIIDDQNAHADQLFQLAG